MGEAQLCGEMGLISKQTQEQTSGGHVDKVATETDKQSHIWKDKQWMNERKAERMEGQVDNQPNGWWDTAGRACGRDAG